MGDLADEIDQMQAEINAFDDKLDAIDGNADNGRDEESPKKNIFSRLGSSGDVIRKSPGEIDSTNEDDSSPHKRRRSSVNVKSAVVDKSRRRESDISKDDINKAQLGNEQGKRRASRMFKNLLGTLRSFDESTKTEGAALKRAEIDKKVEERVAADRRKIMEEKKQLLIKKREKEKLLNLLQAKNELGHLCEIWEENAMRQTKWIRTLTKPQIYWRPRIMDPETKELQANTKEKIIDLLDESKTNWEETKKELTEEINDIKERNEFKDVELETQKNSNGKTSLLGGRLIITKSIRNDQRIVQPKKENGKSKEDDEAAKGIKEEKRLKEKMKERRKEIENARKRRHQSDSESEEEQDRKPRKSKKEAKDVRRIAPKEELKSDPQKSDTNILPSTRRISLKSKKPDIKAELVPEPPKRRRIARKSESSKASDKKASSSSSNSSDSESN